MGTIALKNKTILVTGGHGYLGSFLVKALREEGAIVHTLSRTSSDDAFHHKVDILDSETLKICMQKINPEIVYHLAADISRTRDFSIFERMNQVNVLGTLHLLQAIENIDSHFIFASSSEIYGNNVSPFHEHQIPQPVSPYSLTKVNAENLIVTFCANTSKKFTNLRIFNFYGANMPEDFFIPQMIHSLKRNEDFLMTKGEQMRDFLHVDDVVQALLLTAKNRNSYYETMNVCSGIGTKLCDLAEEINTQISSKARIVLGALPYRANEVWEMIGSNTKIKEKLGFLPQVTLDNGIKRTINNL
ncbi:NAD-dependent epimerase/dehydratase family protein [Flavobacterium aciduliphilum]|uniref:Nucleoside-diphosphate-sugar epimerase n=1 Tax=Flavobacterium aciduliphilum TaxID=1101402 RepID=A0A328YY00_9FLAO|nr:NAD(P)-dependent oxidoreductase [Flavobacterium aciduliphilum]RAR75417.1 nucleoside-diphosphate-sugar epimerase [Flavobacterium aciduliphilum]